MPDHPGGKKVILAYAGKEASEEFNALHSASLLLCVMHRALLDACGAAFRPERAR